LFPIRTKSYLHVVRSLPWLRFKINTGTLIQDKTPGINRHDEVISKSLFGLGPLWGAWYIQEETTITSNDQSVILYFHGGGFSTGSVETHDGVVRRLCAITGRRVLSVEYHRVRFIPNHIDVFCMNPHSEFRSPQSWAMKE
jgi:acetyl esterase/lipase